MTPRVPIIGTNTDSAETFRLAMCGLWVPASADNVRTGVTAAPTLTSTGNFTATVSPFTMVIDGTSNALQGAYPVANDAVATITIGAANTQPRIDLISLQIQDNAYDGSGFSRGQFVVTAGTPAGSPVAPATPANAIPLWTVPVAANATSVVFSSATAVFPFTAAAGGVVFVRNAADKPAAAGGVQLRWRGDLTATAGGTSPLEASIDGTTYASVFDASAVAAAYNAAISAAIAAIPSGYGSWTTFTSANSWNTASSIPLQWRTAPGNRIEIRGTVAAPSSQVAGLYTVTAALPGAATPSSNSWVVGVTNVTGGGTETTCVAEFLASGVGMQLTTPVTMAGSAAFSGSYSL